MGESASDSATASGGTLPVIKGLDTKLQFGGFTGKRTSVNLSAMSPGDLLRAANIVIEGDGVIRPRRGYDLVQTLAASDVRRQMYFQRDSDGARYVLINRGTSLTALPVGGGTEVVLKASESATSLFDATNNYFAAYAHDGNHAYKIVDNAGTLTAYQHGITAPVTTPTESLSAGTLTLTYGRTAVMCFVSYITDAGGTQRMHISAPSPISAHTGPFTNKIITYGSLEVSGDPQVTHKWIFETMDSPLDATSTYYFSGEITNATTSYGSSLADESLDTTRLAPFDNNPAPVGSAVCTYQSRVMVAVGNLVYGSGFEEIDLGIPQEAFPADLVFTLPEAVTNFKVIDEGQTLLIATLEGWYLVRGYNAQTFTKRDRVLTPGCVGKRAATLTPTHMVWLGPDKKIWASDNVGPAMEVSAAITLPQAGTYSMNDLKDIQLQNAELKWFSFGRHNYLIMAANTSDQAAASYNWLAMWYVAVENGAIKGLYQTDFFPTDLLTSMEVVKKSGTQSLYLGDSSTGAVYQWPGAGYTDNGQAFTPGFGTAWLGSDVTRRMFWADMVGNRVDMNTAVTMNAVVSDAPIMTKPAAALTVNWLRSPYGDDGTVCRGNMQQPNTSIGKYVRFLVSMPNDGNETTVSKLVVSSKPQVFQAP
jgi:hypothetical protein